MKDIARSTQTAVLKSLLDHYPKLTTQYLTLASNTLIFLSFPPKQPITISEFDLYPWRESTRSSYENFLTDELDILRTETRRQTSKNMKVFLWWCNSWIFSFGLFSSKDPERKPVVVERWRDFDPREWENKIRRPKDFLTREAFEDIFVLKD
ncbi:hypothetical protein B0J14DRAFT_590468 [Halenospora varia]|nr:hypothetical protein B0J14DRAFT_590468 [Halenospora varia]